MAHIVVPFDEVGPPHVWTIDDLARLPDDERRFEIVDGQLMMVPPPSFGHQAAAKKLNLLLTDACGDRFRVFENAGLDIAPTFRVPDVMVFRASAYSSGAVSVLPQDVVLVVEVVSPGSRTNDRITKPAEYAAAGIGAYWRVELEPTASLTAYVLNDGDSTYTEVGMWDEGEIAKITDPVGVQIEVGALTR